ncbi:MAG TPA: DNA-protecting protein DprA [Desulfuromonadales bacterium]|nr:DNA-protecting protein DprA [Desulfuromonadales bacterium]
MTNIAPDTQAVLLLTTWFTKAAKSDPNPLTASEWGRFANWLKEHEKTPSGLLESGSAADYLAGWTDAKITIERIDYLLGRSVALSLSWEKWQRSGLWVVTRSDPDYPSRLKKHLKADAPPVLFGCGNRQLLNRGGIAMVGSRDATPEQLAATTRIAGDAAMQGYSVVSGGARGVDEVSMLGALAKEGTVIGILADSLLRSATSSKYRSGLMSKNLVLITPFNPEAGFDVGNAMARNKYIYCLSDAAIVVATSKGSGGTWSGAVENLKKGWVPLWVLEHPDMNSGNAALVNQHGATWLPAGELKPQYLMGENVVPFQTPPVESSLFDYAAQPLHNSIVAETEEPVEYATGTPETAVEFVNGGISETSFFEFFLDRLQTATREKPASLEQLLNDFDINKTQLNEWLKRGIEEGMVQKLNKPVRYTAVPVKQQSLGI